MIKLDCREYLASVKAIYGSLVLGGRLGNEIFTKICKSLKTGSPFTFGS